MMGFITHCWRSAARLGVTVALLFWAVSALAGTIEPVRARLVPSDEGYVLSADFAIDLGPRLEEAVNRGVILNFDLEFTLSRHRWYWIDEHVARYMVEYRLSYSALTRQYRITVGSLHQGFESLAEALQFMGRVAARPVVGRGVVKSGVVYDAALRLALDKSQLPKPFQVDAIANPDWQVDAKVLRWQFTPTGDGR